jgi:hypothetical protein
MSSNTGNINYSLNKNDVYKVLAGSVSYVVPHYFILIIISMLYIYRIRYQQYYFDDRNKGSEEDRDVLHFFEGITKESPFNILTIDKSFKDIEETNKMNSTLQNLKKLEKTGIKKKNNIQEGGANKDGKNYVGLTSQSYYLIIASYIISLIIILEGLLRNFIFSIYVNMIQINSNNNPYNNSNIIQKSSTNPIILTTANYTGILSLSYIFLIPFILPFLINFLKFDNYDIKHNGWFKYVVLFFIFYPIIFILLSKAVLYKKLQIFPELNKFLVQKDYPFTTFLQDNFSFKVSTIIIFLFIILVYSYYKLVFTDLNSPDLRSKIITYVLIFLLIFIFLPIFLIFFCFSFLFLNKEKVDTTISTVQSIQNEINNNKSVNSLYELLVKYNYPCFMK